MDFTTTPYTVQRVDWDSNIPCLDYCSTSNYNHFDALRDQSTALITLEESAITDLVKSADDSSIADLVGCIGNSVTNLLSSFVVRSLQHPAKPLTQFSKGIALVKIKCGGFACAIDRITGSHWFLWRSRLKAPSSNFRLAQNQIGVVNGTLIPMYDDSAIRFQPNP
jgi:hypothetical protein